MSQHDIILIGDPRVAAVPVEDNGEAILDLLGEPGLRVDTSRKFVNKLSPSISRLREGVIARLVGAQAQLPSGMAFLIREGHRPVSVQQFLFDRYLGEVRTHHSGLEEAELLAETSKFVAPPHISPHSTGAAVDLTLYNLVTGQELDMGSSFNADPIETAGATYTNAANISTLARANRDTMSAALEAAGFVNYPTEWWHWSYGDRYWAYISGQPYAIYGSVETG